MRAGAQLARPRGRRLGRVVVQAHRADGPVDLVVEERFVHVEGQGGQPHERHDQAAHRAVVRCRGFLEPGGRPRPEVRLEVPPPGGRRVIGRAGDVDGADVEELLQIRRRNVVVRRRERFAANGMIAAVGAGDRMTSLQLVGEREREELVGTPPQAFHETIGHAVASDGEEADLTTGFVDGARDGQPRGSIAVPRRR